MASDTITRIEWGVFAGIRPRHAGSNARIGDHGTAVRVPTARITTSDGTSGWGRCVATQEQAMQLLGQSLAEVFALPSGTAAAWRVWDYPLWDLAGMRAGQPVYALLAHWRGKPVPMPFSVPAYDTSLYFDDLHLADDAAAADCIAAEARAGYERGHRAFKIKVGRGARWMAPDAGIRRDSTVVRAVRDAVGRGLPIMLDANNGYNLNLTKQVLHETADCGIFWLEEPFHEDARLYEELRAWLQREQLPVLIADGEGDASGHLMEWAEVGLVDVVQYDVFGHTFSGWLTTGATLDAWGRRSAPHHYGAWYGNYVSGHLAGAIAGFTFAEWDEATVPGIETDGYRVIEGRVEVSALPGFGLRLDDNAYHRATSEMGGYVVTR